MEDVNRAVNAALKINENLALLQCNTNYTASLENFKFIQLNVLKKYAELFPNLILGLSDHTPGHSTVLGAVTLGARIIEKHFTDDNNRIGPDHLFSMNPKSWAEMVLRTRELENSLGNGVKKVENNEKETVVVQRRSLWLNKSLVKGEMVKKDDIDILRPSPQDGIQPYNLNEIVGKKLTKNKKKGENIKNIDFE